MSTPPIREAVKNLVELMLDGLRPSDKNLNTLATRAILDVGPALLDELLCRAFDADIGAGHRARLFNVITLLSPGHEQHIACYDTDRFLDDPSPQVRRAVRALHARLRTATPTPTSASMMLASSTAGRDNQAHDPISGPVAARAAEASTDGPIQQSAIQCRSAQFGLELIGRL
jgi:hypothetical protein